MLVFSVVISEGKSTKSKVPQCHLLSYLIGLGGGGGGGGIHIKRAGLLVGILKRTLKRYSDLLCGLD